jgi:hypothetical protein
MIAVEQLVDRMDLDSGLGVRNLGNTSVEINQLVNGLTAVHKSNIDDFSGSLRRHFFTFASNAVSQRRHSTEALLTLASPSAQVA